MSDSAAKPLAKTGAASLKKRRIGSGDFVSTFATNVVIQICTVAQGILLARVLGPEGRGQFAAAILWPTLFASLGSLGLGAALARQAARSEDLARIARSAVTASLLTGLLATGVCALGMIWLLPQGDASIGVAAYAFLPFILFNHMALAMIAVDQGAGRFKQFNWTRLIINPVYLLLIVLLVSFGVTAALWFVVALMSANGVVALARLGLAFRQGTVFGPRAPLRGVLKDAAPYAAAGMLSPLVQSADKALLLYLLGPTELGIYAVSLTAASVVNSLAGAAGTVSFGMATQEKDGQGFTRVARIFRLTAWVWLLAGMGMVVVIPFMLPIIYGREFAPAIWPAVALLPGAAFGGQAAILEESMRAQGRAFIGVRARVVGMVVLIGVGVLFVRAWGVIGVAIAASCSQAAVLTIMLFAARTHYDSAEIKQLFPGRVDLAALVSQVAKRMAR